MLLSCRTGPEVWLARGESDLTLLLHEEPGLGHGAQEIATLLVPLAKLR